MGFYVSRDQVPIQSVAVADNEPLDPQSHLLAREYNILIGFSLFPRASSLRFRGVNQVVLQQGFKQLCARNLHRKDSFVFYF